MVHIETFAFFDLETTGLPWMERNQTKIIEFCILAVSRSDILHTNTKSLPTSKKLHFLLNPNHVIPTNDSLNITGIKLNDLTSAPMFENKYESIEKFLKSLAQPLCLIAHNGNAFDYKILKAEVNDIKKRLPENILCLDSMVAFKRLHKENLLKYPFNTSSTVDEWPDLNVTPEEWDQIDELCKLLSNISTNSQLQESTPIAVKKSVCAKKNSSIKQKQINTKKRSYSLTSLYEELTGNSSAGAHRADADCQMLLECVVATRDAFLPWADENCKPLSEIKALMRY